MSEVEPTRPNVVTALVRSLRPKQFIKNGLLFAPGLFSARVGGRWLLNEHVFFSLVVTFVLFSLTAGCTYIINDYVDLERDRANPDKRHRPMAAGHLNPKLALGFALVLMGSVLAFETFVRSCAVGAGFLAYVIITLSYSFWLKRVVIIDIMTIAGLFILRTYIGCLDMQVPESMWFVSCVGSGALLIAACKRHHEFEQVENGVVQDGKARSVIQEYNEKFLLLLITISTVAALITYTFFALNEGPPGFGYTIPFVIFGILRFLYLALVRGVGGSPELLLLRDWPLIITLGLWTSEILFIYARALDRV